MKIRSALAALCTLFFCGSSAHAAVTVPGDFPTLQAVADWQNANQVFIDTLRISPGIPVEPAIFQYYAPFVITGQLDASGQLPRIGSLALYETGSTRVQSLHIAGPVRYGWGDPTFQGCEIDSTMTWVAQSDPGGVTILSCTLNGRPALDATQYAILDACRVNGTVIMRSNADGSLVVRNCVFTGPGDWAIDAMTTANSAVVGNTIRGFQGGILAQSDGGQFPITDNLIEDCPGTAILVWPSGWSQVGANTIHRCGLGIHVQGADAALTDNVVLDCTGDGIRVEPDVRSHVESNIVARCGGSGFVVTSGWELPATEVWVRNNTSHANAGSGFVLYGEFSFTHNLAQANHGFGVSMGSPGQPLTGCNDWFGNDAGEVFGLMPSSSDLSVDPRSCNPEADDFHLMADSPLIGGDCGLIGALGVGCNAASFGSPSASSHLMVFPNPTAGPLRIAFSLAREEQIDLDVFDLLGRRVAGLVSGVLPAGAHTLDWPGLGASSSGVCFVRLRSPHDVETVRVIRAR